MVVSVHRHIPVPTVAESVLPQRSMGIAHVESGQGEAFELWEVLAQQVQGDSIGSDDYADIVVDQSMNDGYGAACMAQSPMEDGIEDAGHD